MVAGNQPAPDGDEDSDKRRQILDGARTVFLAAGFDGASMGEIARAAGVSKGTLYVYFDNKEGCSRRSSRRSGAQAEGQFSTPKPRRRLGAARARRPIASCASPAASALRTVIAIAERMPEVGRRYYERVPENTIKWLATYSMRV